MSVPVARPFGSLLIANRGEIACRVARTARAMGLRTVAVHSTVDAAARHVLAADEAIELPGETATETYLDIERIVAAARRAGAEAVHPGYGFLSENPAFVEACEAAGLVFVGPPAAAMRAMGLKDAAKALMAEAGVPIVPGYHGAAQDDATLVAEAARIGYPVLIKARAGGGGKGMRRVDASGDFTEALAGARREARASFGDDAVLIERYVTSPRHVEVQVFGDAHGDVVHLFERECSLQRRHQKVIEEAPAPGIDEATRAAMTEAAVRAARAVDYVGAGTVEFIADGRSGLRPDGFWFMEMNTRLQVEHPVTEAVTGVDLVEWQLRVAAGESLPLSQAELRLDGHAFEARLYAEDPAAGFLPATGRLERLAFGAVSDDTGTGDARVEAADGLRVDSGVRAGDTVSPHYDPMLAKLVAHAPYRALALARLERLLSKTVVLGTVTNRDFLLALCRHPDVRAARLDTDLIGRELDVLLEQPLAGSTTGADDDARAARALVAVLRVGARPPDRGGSDRNRNPRALDGDLGGDLGGDFGTASGASGPRGMSRSSRPDAGRALAARLGLWSVWGRPRRTARFREADGGECALEVVREGPARWSVSDADGALALALDPDALSVSGARVVVAGVEREAEVLLGDGRAELRLGERVHRLRWDVPGATVGAEVSGDVLLAPMPGRVIEVGGTNGARVRAGETLVTLEAMKMEHGLVAPRDGVVATIGVVVGAQVAQGDELVRLEPSPETSS